LLDDLIVIGQHTVAPLRQVLYILDEQPWMSRSDLICDLAKQDIKKDSDNEHYR